MIHDLLNPLCFKILIIFFSFNLCGWHGIVILKENLNFFFLLFQSYNDDDDNNKSEKFIST